MDESGRYPLSEAVREEYATGIDDEMLEPLVRVGREGKPEGRFQDGDSVIFYNIRGEREIELTRSLTDEAFHEFPVDPSIRLNFATMISYSHDLNVKVAFSSDDRLRDTLSAVLARSGLKQVKITEAEKAIHLGYFFGGKNDVPEENERRIVIPTRKDVRLFDEAPEMSIDVISSAVVEEIEGDAHDVIIVNFPNVDVVGHIENRRAVIRAVEAVDRALGIVVEEAERRGITVLITADHGTVEKWLYPDGKVDTGHTDSPVPFILVDRDESLSLRERGALSDVAPTILDLMGIEKPHAMTGNSLVNRSPGTKRNRLVLVILDGWGMGGPGEGNLIRTARTPIMDRLMESFSLSVLDASGEAVGLPSGTVGNSEVGHLHLGAGRPIYSDRVRINKAIEDGSFFDNAAFNEVMDRAKETGRACHLLGIVSFFSSHGSLDHLHALMELARKKDIRELYIHGMLGRRGEKPESGALYVRSIEKHCEEMSLGALVSVIGRYWSMDREENWNRIEKTYRMLVHGEGRHVGKVK